MSNKTEITASPGGREVIITRQFDAPRDKVWRAYTEPELVVQWLGPKRLKGRVGEWKVMPGGKWELIHTDTDGTEYLFHGFFHTVKSPELISRTFEYHGAPNQVSFEVLHMQELGDGRTKTVATAVYETVEARDSMIESGMERGVNEGNERLDELLTKL